MYVREINEITTLSKFQEPWKRLLEGMRSETFFHTYEWLAAYWDAFGEGQRLRVLVVENQQQVVQIVPLTVRREQTHAGPVRLLSYPLHDWGSFYAPIGRMNVQALAAAACHIVQTQRDWDVYDLRWIAESDLGLTRTAMSQAGVQFRVQSWKTIPIIDLPSSWDEYLQSRSSRFRSNIRWYRNRLHRQGKVQYSRYRFQSGSADVEAQQELFDWCFDISKRSWQHSSTDGTTLSTPSVEPFLRACHDLAVQQGYLDLNLLRFDGVPIAYCYNYHARGYVFGLRTAFDPAYAKLAPGLVLQSLQIEDSIARGDRLIDLAEGYLESKRRWTTRTVETYRCTHYAPRSLKAQLLNAKHWLGHVQQWSSTSSWPV